MPATSENWCRTCCTRHDDGPPCPGELLATGPERFGWRVTARKGGLRTEEFAVLIAPSGDLWRARLLTLPNMLWCVPGGRATMKFVGRSAPQVEARARRFVERFCASRGLECCAPSAAPEAGGFSKEVGRAMRGGATDERLLHRIAVRFGEDRPALDGHTADLSKGGMFVVTQEPLAKGKKVKLTLHLPAVVLPLRGVVAWSRSVGRDGREPGMGVQLVSPPALYQHYVARLADQRQDETSRSAVAQPAASG